MMMDSLGVNFSILLPIATGVVLFLFGIEQFSKEILAVAGSFFRNAVQKMAKTPIRAAISGAIVTAIIQSSTATTVITTSLVNAGLLTFSQSIGVIFGANVGTSITAQLIALKLTAFAPIFLIVGFVLDIIGGKYKFLGKPLFYFGLVFFSLILIEEVVSDLKNDQQLLEWFTHFTNPIVGIIVGFIITNILMSSSVTSGLAVVFAQSGLIGLYDAVLIILGANIGTTTTALLASTRMSLFAKRTAMAHFVFNLLGAAIILFFLNQFIAFIQSLGGNAGQMVANAHLIFNLSAAIVFLVFINQFERLVVYLVPGKEKEILLKPKYLNSNLPKDRKEALELVEKEIKYALEVALSAYEEVIEAIKTKKDCKEKIDKLETYADLLDKEITDALLELSRQPLEKEESNRVADLVRISNKIEQLADIAAKMGNLYVDLKKRGVFLSEKSLINLLENYLILRENFNILIECFPKINKKRIEQMRNNDGRLQKSIEKSYNDHIHRMTKGEASVGGAFIEIISLISTANDHLRGIRKILELGNIY
ncbi:MAG: Na/Pi cotransporter family protein [Candidatus Bilamarchaeaceae archaeon]